jgi:hypothetical protein
MPYHDLKRELQATDPETYALTVLNTLRIAQTDEDRQADIRDLIYIEYSGLAVAGSHLATHAETQPVTTIEADALQFGGMVAIVSLTQLPDSSTLQTELRAIPSEDFGLALDRVLDQEATKGFDDLVSSIDALAEDYPAMHSIAGMFQLWAEGSKMPKPEEETFVVGGLTVNLALKEMIDTVNLESITVR